MESFYFCSTDFLRDLIDDSVNVKVINKSNPFLKGGLNFLNRLYVNDFISSKLLDYKISSALFFLGKCTHEFIVEMYPQMTLKKGVVKFYYKRTKFKIFSAFVRW